MKPNVDLRCAWLHAGLKQRLIEYIQSLPEDDYAVVIAPIIGKASQRQHKYYRGHVVLEFAKWRYLEQGEDFDTDDAHRVLAEMFMPRGIESSADLSTPQMTKYIEDCRHWLSILGIPTENPNPAWREELQKRRAS